MGRLPGRLFPRCGRFGRRTPARRRPRSALRRSRSLRRGGARRRGRRPRRRYRGLVRSGFRRALGRPARGFRRKGGHAGPGRGAGGLDRPDILANLPQFRPLGGFYATIARHDWAAFERAGFSEAGLRTKKLRLRGIVESGKGPHMDLFHPEQIELWIAAAQGGEIPRFEILTAWNWRNWRWRLSEGRRGGVPALGPPSR